MPKQTFNIDDFSGGLNTSNNKRDLEVNESPDVDGLMSYKSGMLDLRGGFIKPTGFGDTTGGFKEEYVYLGINNLYAAQPDHSFRTVNIATVTVSSDVATFTTSGSHGLSTGTDILVYNQSDNMTTGNWIGKKMGGITSTGPTTFTVTGATGLTTNVDVVYAVNAVYDDTDNIGVMNRAPHIKSVAYNMFLLKAAHFSKFGFYNAGIHKGWNGSAVETTNAFGGNSWLFDTRFLWDWDQREQAWTSTTANSSNGMELESLKVLDAFYESGAVRVLTEGSGKWNGNTCRRPVNYTLIPKRTHFYNSSSWAYNIAPGWYPLRSHILCQQEHTDSSQTSYPDAGNLTLSFGSTTLSTFCAATSEIPIGSPYKLEIGVGTGDNAKEGDWQFATGNARKIGLGVSLIYDSMEKLQQSESPVCKLSGTANFAGEGSVADDKALYLYLKLSRGKTAGGTANTGLAWGLYDATTQSGWAIPELRGSGVDSSTGFSNHGAWNPRIVGVNIWLTEDYNGEFSSPLWLAEIPFKAGELGKACDGVNTSQKLFKTGDNSGLFTGGQAHTSHVIFKGIQTIPTLSYLLKNGYKHNENISAWYKTSAIVNRRLFAGNVSYFDHKPQDAADINNDEKMVSFPDRILVSPAEKFDILPSSNWIDVMPQDGQNITKLVGFNKNLLVFKNNDLFVIDCTSMPPTLVKTIKGKGVNLPTMVTQTPEYVFWCNSDGVYGIGNDNEILDLLQKVSITHWKNIYNIYTHLAYDPQANYLIILGKKEGESLDDKRAMIIDLKTGSIFGKTNPAEYSFQNYSGSVIMDNNLYVTGFIPGTDEIHEGAGEQDQGEEFLHNEQTEHLNGEHAQGMISFQFDTSDSSAGQNIPSSNVKHLQIRQGTTWRPINANAFNIGSAVNAKRAAARFVKNANFECLKNDYYKVNFDYNEDTEFFTCAIRAKVKGTGYNTVSQSLSGASVYGTTGVALASGTAEENISSGNIANFSMSGLTNGVNTTAGVIRITADRNGHTTAGVTYLLSLHITSDSERGKASDGTFTWMYVTGNSNKYNGTDPANDETDGSASDATINDRLLENLHDFYSNNHALVPFSNLDGTKVYMGDLVTIGSIGGISGDKYFDLTVKDDVLDENDSFEFHTESYTGTGGELLKWDNLTTKIYHRDATYQTPDFDFGQPNVRKKIYKAYITYKMIASYNGTMKVYYKVNQGSSWTAATTPGTSVDSILDTSSNFTRQEIKFGTDANSCYSFALKVTANSPIKLFEINDITIVYRVKSVK